MTRTRSLKPAMTAYLQLIDKQIEEIRSLDSLWLAEEVWPRRIILELRGATRDLDSGLTCEWPVLVGATSEHLYGADNTP